VNQQLSPTHLSVLTGIADREAKRISEERARRRAEIEAELERIAVEDRESEARYAPQIAALEAEHTELRRQANAVSDRAQELRSEMWREQDIPRTRRAALLREGAALLDDESAEQVRAAANQ
jgi:hypothetical protein